MPKILMLMMIIDGQVDVTKTFAYTHCTLIIIGGGTAMKIFVHVILLRTMPGV